MLDTTNNLVGGQGGNAQGGAGGNANSTSSATGGEGGAGGAGGAGGNSSSSSTGGSASATGGSSTNDINNTNDTKISAAYANSSSNSLGLDNSNSLGIDNAQDLSNANTNIINTNMDGLGIALANAQNNYTTQIVQSQSLQTAALSNAATLEANTAWAKLNQNDKIFDALKLAFWVTLGVALWKGAK